MILLPSPGSPYLTDDWATVPQIGCLHVLGLLYYWLCFHKLHHLCCCVDIMNHFARRSKFTMVWPIRHFEWEDSVNTDTLSGASDQGWVEFHITDQLLTPKKKKRPLSDARASLISLGKQQKSKLHQHLIWNVNFMAEYKPTCLCFEQHFNDYKMPSSETPISLLYHISKLQSINFLLSYLMIVDFPECTWHVCLIRAHSQQCWLLELGSVFFFF